MIKTYGARKLGVRPAHRRLMLAQLATALLHFERLTTTRARGKELKTYLERAISRLKKIKSPFLLRRRACLYLAHNSYEVEKKLITTLLPRFAARKGGFIRLIPLRRRASDQAPIVRVELLQ